MNPVVTAIPTLKSQKVTLAPFRLADAALVQRYAGDPAVARTTLNVPHPYPDGAAEKWIASHLIQFLEQRNVVLSIRSHGGELYGAINICLDMKNRIGELGYWMGAPFWGLGYCTDAARTVIRYGFDAFPLNKIYARHLAGNTASGRVMQKAGMILEGFQRQQMIKNEVPMDVVEYGILRGECKSG